MFQNVKKIFIKIKKSFLQNVVTTKIHVAISNRLVLWNWSWSRYECDDNLEVLTQGTLNVVKPVIVAGSFDPALGWG